jgi:hypothetical protein
MKRFLSIIFLFLLPLTLLNSQSSVGEWTDHLIYNTATALAVSDEDVYASTGYSVLVYNKDLAELKKLSRISGLSETGISTIAWSDELKSLIIGYSSTNVDIVKDNVIYNLPDILRKYIPGRKAINRIRTNGKYAYLACSFGIVVADIGKREIYDTWKPGIASTSTEVWDIAFSNGKIYAATGSGVYYANLTDPGLAYFGNWKSVNSLPSPQGNYTAIVFSGNKFFVNRSDVPSDGDHVYAIGDETTLFSYTTGVYNKSFDASPTGFAIASTTSARFYNPEGSLLKTIISYGPEYSAPEALQVIPDNGNMWIADRRSGLMKGENMTSFSALTLPGPASNKVIYISSRDSRTYISGGALTSAWDNTWSPLEVSVHADNKWSSVISNSFLDPVRTIGDPDNPNRFFVATWGMGLLEYENNTLVKQYNDANSPLQTIIPGRPYVRVCGLAFDDKKNLWVTQTGVPGSIKVLKPDGTWVINPIRIEASTIGDIMITKTGIKWVVLPGIYGIFVLDDNKTPEIFTDDKYKKITVKDGENNTYPNVICICEDLEGSIWVGTKDGPLVYYNPGKVFESDLSASRVKIPRNDGSDLADYLLQSEIITSIAVDGANRKWIGTAGSGAYLVSADGLKTIKHFNEQNSPILSNTIASIAVDNITGEVWFGTSKGVQSIRGDATTGTETFGNVYAFPNPVRENFTGNVTITGLIRDSQIRITDVSGNLVYSTVSDGGLATWDLKTYNGKRVSTGVYLIFCASSDGTQSCVTKMLVIH